MSMGLCRNLNDKEATLPHRIIGAVCCILLAVNLPWCFKERRSYLKKNSSLLLNWQSQICGDIPKSQRIADYRKKIDKVSNLVKTRHRAAVPRMIRSSNYIEQRFKRVWITAYTAVTYNNICNTSSHLWNTLVTNFRLSLHVLRKEDPDNCHV